MAKEEPRSTQEESTTEDPRSRRGSVLSDQDIKAEITRRGLVYTEDGESCLELVSSHDREAPKCVILPASRIDDGSVAT